MKKFSLRKVGNHWYAGIEHSYDEKMNFNSKIDRILNVLDASKNGDLTIEFEELGSIVEGINVLYLICSLFNIEHTYLYSFGSKKFE